MLGVSEPGCPSFVAAGGRDAGRLGVAGSTRIIIIMIDSGAALSCPSQAGPPRLPEEPAGGPPSESD